MVVKKKSRKVILKKKDNKLDTIGYSKLDIMWFWQWLKLAVDMEGQTIEFVKNVYGTKWRDPIGTETTKKTSITAWIPQVTKVKIKFNDPLFKKLNINELKRLPKIMNMNKREIFTHFNKWFEKNKHLFTFHAVHYAPTNKDMIEDDNYITFQVPKSLDRRKIDNQIDAFISGYNLRTTKGNNRVITFMRGVQKDVMAKQWEVYKWKTTTKEKNQKIASEVGYTQKFQSGQYESAKCIIVNVSKGIFPKSILD